MSGYRERVADDLNRWIAAGLVPSQNRAAILSTLPQQRRLDAVTALIWIAGVLLALAITAFVAANWQAIPRLWRFVLLLSVFLGVAASGAETYRRGRAVVSDVALTIASLVFASAIGLTGQIFEVAGENPPALPYGAGAVALAFGVAGASRGALAVGVAGMVIGDFIIVADDGLPIPVSLLVAPLACALALWWRSAFLTHVASIAMLGVALWFAIRYDAQGWGLLVIAAVVAALAIAAAVLAGRGGTFSAPATLTSIPLFWFVFGALGFFVIAGYTGGISDHSAWGLAHRVCWIAVSAGLITVGRFARRGAMTGLGVMSLIVACCALMHDLGLNLIVISLVFFVCSILALIVGVVVRVGRRGSPTQEPT